MQLDLPAWPAGVHGVFTRRAGGVSAAPYDALNLGDHVGDDPAAVAANRERVATRLGVDPGRMVFLRQVHGARVVVAEDVPAEPPEADAVVTARPGLVLAVLAADCVPVLLADAEAGVLGAAHAGRPGVRAGVVPATVAAMRRLGARPDRIVAWVGPAVCGACYEVPASMRDDVDAAVPGTATVTRAGTPALDLPGGVRRQLTAAGVRAHGQVGGCTAEDPSYFSYRRDGTTGRLAGLVWRPAR